MNPSFTNTRADLWDMYVELKDYAECNHFIMTRVHAYPMIREVMRIAATKYGVRWPLPACMKVVNHHQAY